MSNTLELISIHECDSFDFLVELYSHSDINPTYFSDIVRPPDLETTRDYIQRLI